MDIFIEFMDKKRFEGITLDAPHAEKLTKLMDWYVIRLEDGSDELAAKLLNDEPRAPASKSSPNKEIRVADSDKADLSENGTKDKEKPPKAGSDDGAASDSEDEKTKAGEKELKLPSDELLDEMKNASYDEGTKDGAKDMDNVSGDEENAKKSPKKKRTISADSGGPQSIQSMEEEDEKSNLDFEKEKEKIKKEAEVEELPQLHRTSSVFLRNISPAVSKAELEAICVKHAGFLRSALADPQPERRWYRRGWVTFKRNVNIKGTLKTYYNPSLHFFLRDHITFILEICWQLNNIRMKDSELGAIVNRDLMRRVRTVNGITPHKAIVRNDIRLAAQVIQYLDSKWNLWDEDPDADRKESFGVYSTNPVLKNITDYLIEEASAEEEELLAMGGGVMGNWRLGKHAHLLREIQSNGKSIVLK